MASGHLYINYLQMVVGGLPNLLQYYIGGVLKNLLQYYRFGTNMKDLRPFSVLHIFLCSAKSTYFVSNLEKFREYVILGW